MSESRNQRALANLPSGWKWIVGRDGQVYAADPAAGPAYRWVEEWQSVDPGEPVYSDGHHPADPLRPAARRPSPEQEET